MKFRKYEFEPTKWEELKSDIQISYQIDDETILEYNSDIVVSVVEIGFITKEDNTLSDKYSVDILWQTEELPSFASHKIWCTPVGIHSFGASIDQDYNEAYLEQLAN